MRKWIKAKLNKSHARSLRDALDILLLRNESSNDDDPIGIIDFVEFSYNKKHTDELFDFAYLNIRELESDTDLVVLYIKLK